MRPITRLLRLSTLAVVLCLPATSASAQGDEWIANRDYGKARAEYQAAADILREDGEFPVIALRRIVDSYYFEGDYPRAIRVLDDLAEEAATHGDLATEAWALADAAWVMGRRCFARDYRAGFKLEIQDRVDKLKELLESPYMPEDVRAEITANRCDGCHTVAPGDRRELTCYPSDPQ